MFRLFEINLIFNDKHFGELWIDPHYEAKHKASINDALILLLVLKLNHEVVPKAGESKGFCFYQIDLEYSGKRYRLILAVPPDGSYLGVRNVYRRSK